LVNRGLSTYALLSRLGFPKSYRGKIFCITFVGMHVPTVALVLYLLLSSHVGWGLALGVLGLLLVVTLAGTAATLYALNGLLAPVRLACSSLREYVDSNKVPDLPIEFADEAGRLMADVQYAIDSLDFTIRSLQQRS